MAERVGGIITVKVNGETQWARGQWTVFLGTPKREGVAGTDRVHGYKEMIQIPFVEGEITDKGTIDLVALTNLTDATITVERANGKVATFANAWYAGDAQLNTEEGSIKVRFESETAFET